MKLNKSKKTNLLVFFFILLFGVIAYLPSFSSSFHLDDYDQIIKNNLKHISTAEVFNRFPATRWLVFFSFKANAAIHGYNTFGYHLINFLIHIFSAFLIFKITELILYFIKRNAPLGAIHLSEKYVALAAGIIFAVHPLQSQAVIYITQRLMLGATLFYLLAMYSFLRGFLPDNSKRQGIIFTIIFFVLGMFCKEIIVTLPVILFLILWLFLQPKAVELWIKKHKLLFVGIVFLILLIPVIVFLNIIKWDLSQLKNTLNSIGGALYANTPGLDRYTYLLTQTKVLLKYIALFVFPIGLQIDPDVSLCSSFISLCFLISFFTILIMVAGAWLLRKKAPMISFGIIFYFIALLPQSSIIPTPDLMFEHRVYLGVAGLIWIFLGILALVAKYITFKYFKIYLYSGIIIIILILTFLTFNRSKIWKNDVTLWADAYEKSPQKARVINNYANALLNNGMQSNAVVVLEKALKENKKIPPYVVSTLANLYAQNGRFPEARNLYLKSLKADYTNPETRYNLALMYYFLGNIKSAKYQAYVLRQIHPEYTDAYYLLGVVYSAENKNFSSATNNLTIYLQKSPDGENAESAKDLMNILLRKK